MVRGTDVPGGENSRFLLPAYPNRRLLGSVDYFVISELTVTRPRSSDRLIRSAILFLIMADLEDIANSIRRTIPDLKWGSMRLWGQSLGRPGEDGHKLIECEAINGCLRLKLEDDEVLAVWNPLDVKITTKRFRIGSADSIRFTSYYCGRPQLPENILYRDYTLQDELVWLRTNEE